MTPGVKFFQNCLKIFCSRGQEFRTDFSGLAVLRSYIQDLRFLAVTATSTKIQVQNFSKTLCLKNLKVVTVSPNRKNIFLSTLQRKPSLYGFEGVKEILFPIAKKLLAEKIAYPITIIYMKLQFCGAAYKLFDKILKNEQYVDGIKSPSARLFNQFHAPTTSGMKDSILEEIKNEKSRTRVIFATTALGMGVDAPNIAHVIHIGPPSSMECYVQEFGRAGRTKSNSWATLYWNNSDIASNTHIEKSIKDYCLTQTCLREFIMTHFGYPCQKQERCCHNCHPNVLNETDFEKHRRKIKKAEELKKHLHNCVEKYSNVTPEYYFMDFDYPDFPSAECIMEAIDDIILEGDLLYHLNILNLECRLELFDIIEKHAPFE